MAGEFNKTRYAPLNVGQHNEKGAAGPEGCFEIRVLDIMPAETIYQDIVCKLRVVNLKECAGTYEALSYTWGDSSCFQYILLEAQRFQVSHNLWVALRNLRLSDRPRCMWIDALCINQADTSERALMVSQMHKIYRRALRTIAWIGESTPASKMAMTFPSEQSRSPSPSWSMLKVGGDFHVDDSRNSMSRAALAKWDALGDLFGRTWYTRAWIVQEVACSQHWTLKCGESEIGGHLIFGAQGLFRDILIAASHNRHKLPMHVSTMLQRARGLVWADEPRPEELGVLLSINRRRHAKDDRDKIYAFTNMLSSPIVDLYPDYEIPTFQLYYQAARQIILLTSSLKILAECENEKGISLLAAVDIVSHNYYPDLPSWCPNWANRRVTNGLWGGYSAPSALPFCATGGLKAKSAFLPKHVRAKNQLIKDLAIQGIALDEVRRCGDNSHGLTLDLETCLLDSLGTINGESHLRAIDDDDNENSAILRTLTLDRDVSGRVLYKDMLPDQRDPSFQRAIAGRRFFTTTHGFIGLGSYGIETGDLVVLFPGCHVPIVLRQGCYWKTKAAPHLRNGICTTHRQILSQDGMCSGEGCLMNHWYSFWEVIGEACEFVPSSTPSWPLS